MNAASPIFPPFPAVAPRRGAAARRRGFTLIEAMMVTVIIGVGVMGMLQLLASGTIANNESSELTTAVQLANNINEWTVRLAYDDLRTVGTYAGKTYTPPVDGRGQQLIGFPGWSQRVQVRYVDENNIAFEVPDTQVEPVSRVTVTVYRNGQQVHATGWLVGIPPEE